MRHNRLLKLCPRSTATCRAIQINISIRHAYPRFSVPTALIGSQAVVLIASSFPFYGEGATRGKLCGEGEACAGVELEVGIGAGVCSAQLIGDRAQIKVAV